MSPSTVGTRVARGLERMRAKLRSEQGALGRGIRRSLGGLVPGARAALRVGRAGAPHGGGPLEPDERGPPHEHASQAPPVDHRPHRSPGSRRPRARLERRAAGAVRRAELERRRRARGTRRGRCGRPDRRPRRPSGAPSRPRRPPFPRPRPRSSCEAEPASREVVGRVIDLDGVGRRGRRGVRAQRRAARRGAASRGPRPALRRTVRDDRRGRELPMAHGRSSRAAPHRRGRALQHRGGERALRAQRSAARRRRVARGRRRDGRWTKERGRSRGAAIGLRPGTEALRSLGLVLDRAVTRPARDDVGRARALRAEGRGRRAGDVPRRARARLRDALPPGAAGRRRGHADRAASAGRGGGQPDGTRPDAGRPARGRRARLRGDPRARGGRRGPLRAGSAPPAPGVAAAPMSP